MLWLGGPPASGKTTIATRLARRHGLRWFSADARTWVHRDRAIAAGSAAAIRWEKLTPAERQGGTIPAAEMLELSLHHERGTMIADDLAATPSAPLIVAEGTALPAPVAAENACRALWLSPTPAVQRARLDERCLAPATRDFFLFLAETIEREAREHELPILHLDSTQDVEATLAAVEEHFANELEDGPHAQTLAERRTLLREANEAIVEQVRRYCARPWADADADAVQREFLCECGDRECAESVRIRVGIAAAGPLFAAGHR